ncbi:uncharacterized protein HaLaN_11338, partial [Haematococcus lacustris]
MSAWKEFGLHPLLEQGLAMQEREMQEAEAAEAGPTTSPLDGRLRALIMTPTRELALQVSAHLTALGKVARIRVAAIVGGLAHVKQTRLLAARPSVLVATPGRLWELLREASSPHLADFGALSFLVLDEADRMAQKGHFQVQVPFRGDPAIVDLTAGSHQVAAGVTEAYVPCMEGSDRDALLYYLLVKHPGRTLVFANAVTALRRVAALLKVLGLPAHAIHAQQQQRQRLKALDRFKSDDQAVLVASDVAARGLDIPGVSLPPSFPIDKTLMPLVVQRVKLALKIDEVERAMRKELANSSWATRQAAEAGLDEPGDSDQPAVACNGVGRKRGRGDAHKPDDEEDSDDDQTLRNKRARAAQ